MMYEKIQKEKIEKIMNQSTLESSLNYYHKPFPTLYYI